MNHVRHLELRSLVSARSIISILGLAVGFAALVSLLSVVPNVRSETVSRLGLGTEDVVAVEFSDMAASSEARRAPRRSAEVIARFQTQLPAGTRLATFGAADARMTFNGRSYGIRAAGVTTSFFDIFDIPASHGRALAELDRHHPVAVLGSTQARALAGNRDLKALVGSQFQLGETVFTIAGVLEPVRLGLHDRISLDDAVIISSDVLERRLPEAGVTNALIAMRHSADQELIVARIDQMLENQDTRGAKIVSFSEMRLRITREIRMLTLVLVGVGGLAFILGSFGIGNLLLGHLASRRHEIGLRRALGASRRSIVNWFVAESLLASVTAVLAGTTLAAGVSVLLAALREWDSGLSIPGVGLSIALTVAIGAAAGLLVGSAAAGTDLRDALGAED